MLVRFWTVTVRPGTEDDFERVCRDDVVPMLDSFPACGGSRIVRLPAGPPTRYTFVTLWTDESAIAVARETERWQHAAAQEFAYIEGEPEIFHGDLVARTDR